VSTKILIAALLWAVGLNAQGLDQRFTVTGEIQSGSVPQIGGFVVEVYQSQNHTLAERVMTSGDGRFQIHNVTAGWYTVRVLATPGADPLIEEYLQVSHGGAPIVLQLPVRSKEKGPGEIISLRELQHPVNKKAVRCLVEAARYRQRNEPLKAVAKLEEAVRIDPEFRDAHTNLGTEYARAGRVDEDATISPSARHRPPGTRSSIRIFPGRALRCGNFRRLRNSGGRLLHWMRPMPKPIWCWELR
jgi:tetratricopeptide (TPR) repeat protein